MTDFWTSLIFSACIFYFQITAHACHIPVCFFAIKGPNLFLSRVLYPSEKYGCLQERDLNNDPFASVLYWSGGAWRNEHSQFYFARNALCYDYMGTKRNSFQIPLLLREHSTKWKAAHKKYN